MKYIIPFTLCGILLCIALVFVYFGSPAYQIQSLQNENALLKSQISELQNDNQSELVGMVIVGFLTLTLILLGAFFLILCILARVRPGDFFTVRKYPALQAETRPEIENKTAEIINCPVASVHYAYEWRA